MMGVYNLKFQCGPWLYKIHFLKIRHEEVPETLNISKAYSYQNPHVSYN